MSTSHRPDATETHRPEPSAHPTSLAPRPTRIGGVLLAGVALLAAAIYRPTYWVFLLGAALTSAGVALAALRAAGRRPGSRPWLARTGALSLAVLLAASMIAVPRLALSRLDGPYLWRDDAYRGPGSHEAVLLAEVLLIVDAVGVRGLDPGSGRELYVVSDPGERVTVGSDGTFVIQDGSESRYHGADGALLWRIPSNSSDAGRPTAIADGMVVLPECAGQRCVHRGYDSSGAEAWAVTAGRRPLMAYPVQGHADGFDRVRVAPEVVPVTGVTEGGTEDAGEDDVTILGVDGRVQSVRPGQVAGAVDEVVVLRRADCQHEGIRDGEVIWSTEEMPCTGSALGVLFRDRFYAWPAEGDELVGTITVDLNDGQWRRTPPLHLNPRRDGLPDSTTGVAGNELWIERDGQRLTGVDAATGKVLWRFRAPGDAMSQVDVGNGAVMVVSEADRRLTVLGRSDARKQLTVLDARTGRVTARLILDTGLWEASGAGPGRAYVKLTSTQAGMAG